MMPQQYCLRWKHHHTNVQNMFAQLLEKERFCDVTLYCSPSFATQVSDKDTVDPQHIRGVSLRAHRVVLAACSELLGALLGAHDAQGEPVLVIDGAEPKHLKALLDYMYTGEMNVHHSQLASLLKTAEELRIKGLTDIRWNNKDEPPDCDSGVVTTVATNEKKSEPKMIVKAPEPKPVLPKHTPPKQPSPKQPSPKHVSPKHTPPKLPSPKHTLPKLPSPKHASPKAPSPRLEPELRTVKMEVDIGSSEVKEKLNINGGPPPLIKLPTKEKCSPLKREPSDSDTPSPKRLRLTSITEHTDDESVSHSISEKDAEWQHGNLDITAERVVSWGSAGGGGSAGGSWSREPSDDEWADAPTDIGSFLHTRLRVDGDNSAADDESNDSTGEAPSVVSAAASSTSVNDRLDVKLDMAHTFSQKAKNQERTEQRHAPRGGREGKCKVAPSKYGPVDPRFPDVVKLSDYLQHGRRPQFWEERYVKRVMEAVRVKELEMKQAAEILGVSYGTLYGRYRDVYGCINRPYRTARDFWAAKGPSEVLERLQRGEISVEAASLALGVGVSNLAAYMAADFNHPDKEFEPIPIEMDPSLSVRRMYNPGPGATSQKVRKPQTVDKTSPKKVVGGTDEESIPATIISTSDTKQTPVVTTVPASGKWPTIRVASLDTLRGGDTLAPPLPSAVSPPAPAPSPSPSPSPAPVPSPASPSALMRTRPDLTIVAAKKTDKRGEET